MMMNTLICIFALLELHSLSVSSLAPLHVATLARPGIGIVSMPGPRNGTVATSNPYFDDGDDVIMMQPPKARHDAHAPSATKAKDMAKALTFTDAIRIIDECAVMEKPCEELYEAVRHIERNAYQFYPTLAEKEDLWDRAQGSWKLVLSTGDAKTRAFHPPTYLLPFSFAMIHGQYFGNGFGLNPDNVFVSVLQKHYFDAKIRQMVVTVQDLYLGGNKVARDKIPAFIQKAINIGKTPQQFKEELQKKPPAFCLVAATDNALIARGNQSGALAIWKRLPRDIHHVAYKDIQ